MFGIHALELLGGGQKDDQRAEKNNPRIAKKLMNVRMKEGKKKMMAQAEATATAASPSQRGRRRARRKSNPQQPPQIQGR